MRDYRDPWLLIDREYMAFLGVIGGCDHRNLAQPFGKTAVHIIRVAVPQIVLDMRMLFLERGDPSSEEAGAAAFDGSDVERSLKPFPAFADVLLRTGDQVKDLGRVLQEEFTFRCQIHLMRRTDKKRCAKLRLQILNLTA